MKNTTFFALFVLLSYTLFAQERILIPGRLLYKSTDIVAANVINNSAQIATITDASGEFQIKMKEGDEIIFSALTIRIKVVKITPEIISKKRLEINVEENISALDEVIVTPENVEKFIDLKEEEFKGFDYTQDKSTKVINKLADDRQVINGIDFVKPSEILPFVFEDSFFKEDLDLQTYQIVGFLEYVDSQLKSTELLKQSQQFLLIDYLIEMSKNYKKNLAL